MAWLNRVSPSTLDAALDVEGSKEDRCELTRTPYGKRFISERNIYVSPVVLISPLLVSNVTYDDSMNLLNTVWLAPLPSNSTKAWAAPGVLVALDACPDGIIYRYLITEYVNTQGLHAKVRRFNL
ncbi:unnamed protein product [Malus baccata var. baccata]